MVHVIVVISSALVFMGWRGGGEKNQNDQRDVYVVYGWPLV